MKIIYNIIISFLLFFSSLLYADGVSLPININSTTQGVISVRGQINTYTFNISSSGTLLVYTTGSSDTYAELLDSDGNIIARDDDSGASTNLRISTSVTVGSYTLKVKLYSRNQLGSYTLQSSCVGCTSSTSTSTSTVTNNTGSNSTQEESSSGSSASSSTESSSSTTLMYPDATVLAPVSGTTNANISSGGQRHYYRLNIVNRGVVSLYTDGRNDTYGELLNSRGSVVSSNDDGGTSTNFRITYTLEQGVYYLRVKLYSNNHTGPYSLTWNCPGCSSSNVAVNDTVYSNSSNSSNNNSESSSSQNNSNSNTSTSSTSESVSSVEETGSLLYPDATILTNQNTPLYANISTGGQQHYYRLNVSSNSNINIYTEGRNDTYGELLNNNGTVIATNDDGGVGTNFRINRTLLSGSYYLKVRLYSNNHTGGYTLALECTTCLSTNSSSANSNNASGASEESSGNSNSEEANNDSSGSINNSSESSTSNSSDTETISNVTSLGTWNVPFLRQHDYVYINEAAGGATSVAMLLRFFYPNSYADPRVVYHSGTQGYMYNMGSGAAYRNVKHNASTGSLELAHVHSNSRSNYISQYIGTRMSALENYLARIWGIDTVNLTSMSSMISSLTRGPVLVKVKGLSGSGLYANSHFVVVLGVSGSDVIIHDPYDTEWINDGMSGQNRRVSYEDFSNNWFIEALELVPSDNVDQRQYSVVVDSGNNSYSGDASVHEFLVDNMSSWSFSYLDGDWYYHTSQQTRNAIWKPKISRSGRYRVTTSFKGTLASGTVVYRLYNSQHQIIQSGYVNHNRRDFDWASSTIFYDVSLEDGMYILGEVPPNTQIDSIKFKYLGN